MQQPNIQAGKIERVLRHDLKESTGKVAEAAGWDGSSVSRVLSGQQGIPLGKLDAVVKAAGYVMVSRQYLDVLAYLSQIGSYCRCSREGDGECGPGASCGEQPIQIHSYQGRA